jgi:hypothetical protein
VLPFPAARPHSICAMGSSWQSECQPGIAVTARRMPELGVKFVIGLKIEMRRGVQIVVSLLAIVLLVRPFDCFANSRTPEAMACCLKGKCVPSANADDCCKNTVPAVNSLLISKTAGHWTPMLALGVPSVSAPLPPSAVQTHVDLLRRAPPPLNLTTLNRPLLI